MGEGKVLVNLCFTVGVCLAVRTGVFMFLPCPPLTPILSLFWF